MWNVWCVGVNSFKIYVETTFTEYELYIGYPALMLLNFVEW